MLATSLAIILFLTMGTPLASRVRADDRVPESSEEYIPPTNAPLDSSALIGNESPYSEELAERLGDTAATDVPSDRAANEVARTIPEAGAPTDILPISLPGAQAKSAVTPTAISLPTAEGSITGMGESFAPNLSSGTGTYTVPIAIPAGRAGVQPSLALTYSTSAGNSELGVGWSMPVPFIGRQSDRGVAHYNDLAAYHAEEDRFFYNGGQELVPVSGTTAIDGGAIPGEFAGWQQYRARVEGEFLRFFRAPDSRRWIVQSRDGTRFEFGELPAGAYPSDYGDAQQALQLDDATTTAPHIYRWMLARTSDAHGSPVYYRYTNDQGQVYLRDVHYVSPATCAPGGATVSGIRSCTLALSSYARRVGFTYESRADVLDSYVPGFLVRAAQRLARIDVTGWNATLAARTLVRRYHLAYDSSEHLSLLQTVTLEGRLSQLVGGVYVGIDSTPESTVVATAGLLAGHAPGDVLAPMRFTYTKPASMFGGAPGFGGIDTTVHSAGSSPANSVDDAFTDLFDVNSDGLPDVIVTDPARHRTRDGAPAVGVYFNGFSGPGGTASRAGSFSPAVPLPMPAGLSSVFALANPNIVPMDVDGDGRSDLLHMRRDLTTRSYGYFTPARLDGTRAHAEATNPADQGWGFAYVGVQLPREDADARIDLTRDSSHIRTIDVNNDQLIDVVRTTGTVMQTWLNLGWYPGGDGRFGQATLSGSSFALSTAPVERCLLTDALPLDFEDPEMRLADMNGDGMTDIAKMRAGRIFYWPGRGDGVFGTGSLDCPRGAGAGRSIEMENAPFDLGADLEGVFVEDLNQDGLPDLVRIRFDALDVWYNKGGFAFADRTTVRGTPFAPAFSPRIRFADIDGTGTTDIVYANAGRWQWIDPMGGQRPRLLSSIDNALGALHSLEYGSSASEYLRDLATAPVAGIPSYRWSGARVACDDPTHIVGEPCDACDAKVLAGGGGCVFRSGGSPMVSTVVKATQISDRLSVYVGEDEVKRTEYVYHDAYYEGIEHEFRGFGVAEAREIGDVGEHTLVTRTSFHQGRRPNDIASDRLADNPDEAIKGRAYLVESFDGETGAYLASAWTGYALRRLFVGASGYAVSFAYTAQADALTYDNGPYVSNTGGDTVPVLRVRREVATGLTSTVSSTETAVLGVRAAGWAQTRSSTSNVDNAGNTLASKAHGRIRGEFAEPLDAEGITTSSTPVITTHESAWQWRAQSVSTTGDDGFSTPPSTTTYNDRGDPISATQAVTVPLAYEFGAGTDASLAYTQGTQTRLSASTLDAWGNSVASCEGASTVGTACLRRAAIGYDAAFSMLATTESIYTRSGGGILGTTAAWDHSSGALTSSTDPAGQTTLVTFDGQGRLTSLTPPISSSCGSATPTLQIAYDVTTNPATDPLSSVRAERRLNCAGTIALKAYSFIDGFGRARAVLSNGEVPGTWVQTGVVDLNARGEAFRAWHPRLVTASTDAIAVARPPIGSVPDTEIYRDAFGRSTSEYDELNAESRAVYHALSVDAFDPLDITGGVELDTPMTTRSDGHSRTIATVLRNRRPGDSTIEYTRLYSWYRSDGALLHVARARTNATYTRPVTPPLTVDGSNVFAAVARTFTYDSAGRRIATTDPDSDSRSGSRTTANRSWRYLFNPVDDLVAVRDPRGCGQNFFYDVGGRLLGEDYVACTEAFGENESSTESVPNDSIGLGFVGATTTVDVRSFYDAYPVWAGFVPPTALVAGRPTAGADRGQRSQLAYDARGNAIWAARQMALVSDVTAVGATLADPPTLVTTDANLSHTRVYDAAHTYVRTSAYDASDRAVSLTLPTDPDWTGGGAAPLIGGALTYNVRGLPDTASVSIGATTVPLSTSTTYDVYERIVSTTHGDPGATTQTRTYDTKSRPLDVRTDRLVLGMPAAGSLAAVTQPFHQLLTWDAADNLTEVEDLRIGAEWPAGYRPQTVTIGHDALYHVTSAGYTYTQSNGSQSTSDTGQNWRTDMAATRSDDPMRTTPAPAVATTPATRVVDLQYNYDWLANMNEWTDDTSSFYERSIGDSRSGYGDVESSLAARPGALYFSANLPASAPVYSAAADRGGYLEVTYGEGGNVTTMTVHAQCRDVSTIATCWAPGTPAGSDTGGTGWAARRTQARAGCSCQVEQHYQYRWDEVNRLAEARRYDRAAGTGSYALKFRQRHRYDGGNVRTVKQTLDSNPGADPAERVALYVFPGDFERRGLRVDTVTDKYIADATLDTESQYLIGGARVIWQKNTFGSTLDREARVTMPLSDVIGTSNAVLDLRTGALIEYSTYYPNGARETFCTEGSVAPEPMGFTGKEGDEELGITYFGERYLISRIGRWATPDPLQIHAIGGGEVGNSYHYVSGNLLAGRDPVGLEPPTAEQRDLINMAAVPSYITLAFANEPAPTPPVTTPLPAMVRPQTTAAVPWTPRDTRGEFETMRGILAVGSMSYTCSVALQGRTHDEAMQVARAVDNVGGVMACFAAGAGQAESRLSSTRAEEAAHPQAAAAAAPARVSGQAMGARDVQPATVVPAAAAAGPPAAGPPPAAASPAAGPPAGGGARPSGGPGRNHSGSLDDAARAARSQPQLGPMASDHARGRMAQRLVSSERVQEAALRGRVVSSDPARGTIVREMPAASSASGRQTRVVTNARGDRVVTVIDRGRR